MKKILCVVLSLLATSTLVPVARNSYLEYEQKERIKAETSIWSQDNFFFTPTSCKDDSDGADCNIMLTPGIGAALLFPQMGRVYLEGEVGMVKRRKVRLVLEHGTKGKKVPNVPAGHKLVSCFCNQPECLIHTPSKPVYVEYSGVYKGFNFSVVKPD